MLTLGLHINLLWWKENFKKVTSLIVVDCHRITSSTLQLPGCTRPRTVWTNPFVATYSIAQCGPMLSNLLGEDKCTNKSQSTFNMSLVPLFERTIMFTQAVKIWMGVRMFIKTAITIRTHFTNNREGARPLSIEMFKIIIDKQFERNEFFYWIQFTSRSICRPVTK